MADQWHFSINGNQSGPVSSSELKQLASSGKLSQTDLIWKNGMQDWVPAGKVKGLFSVQANTASPPPMPPPISPQPAVRPQGGMPPSFSPPPSLPPQPNTERTNQPHSLGLTELVSPLWDPEAAALWSLLFTPIFGCFLITKNWTRLGEDSRAKSSMLWLGGSVVLVFFNYLLVVSANVQSSVQKLLTIFVCGSSFMYIGFYAAVYYQCLRPQAMYLKAKFPDASYPCRGFGKPIGIAVSCWVLVTLIYFTFLLAARFL